MTDQPANPVIIASATVHGAISAGGGDAGCVLIANQPAHPVIFAYAARHGSAGLGVDDGAALLPANQAANNDAIGIAGAHRHPAADSHGADEPPCLKTSQGAQPGLARPLLDRQAIHQDQVANFGILAQGAKQANLGKVGQGGEAGNAVTIAVKHPVEGRIVSRLIRDGAGVVKAQAIIPAVADGHPATRMGVEEGGFDIIQIQAMAAVAAPGPGAAVPVLVKVQVAGQLIAKAAGLRAAGGVGRDIAPSLVVAAGQVVPNVVQLGQAADLDEAIAVGIGMAGEDHQIHCGRVGIIASGIAGNDAVGASGTDFAGGAGDLAAVVVGGAGDRKALRQWR